MKEFLIEILRFYRVGNFVHEAQSFYALFLYGLIKYILLTRQNYVSLGFNGVEIFHGLASLELGLHHNSLGYFSFNCNFEQTVQFNRFSVQNFLINVSENVFKVFLESLRLLFIQNSFEMFIEQRLDISVLETIFDSILLTGFIPCDQVDKMVLQNIFDLIDLFYCLHLSIFHRGFLFFLFFLAYWLWVCFNEHFVQHQTFSNY